MRPCGSTYPDDDVAAPGALDACRLEHGVGLADAGGCTEENAQSAAPRARLLGLHGVRAAGRGPAARPAEFMRMNPALLQGLASSARFSSSTFTRGSPKIPKVRPRVARRNELPARVPPAGRAPARRGAAWYSAAAGEMCGSRPLPDAVTRSTGTGASLPGSAARSAAIRAPPPRRAPGSSGPGCCRSRRRRCTHEARSPTAGSRNSLGAENGCPSSSEPTALPSRSMMLPRPGRGNASRADRADDQRDTRPRSAA